MQHGGQHGVQPQRRHRCGAFPALCRPELRHLVRCQQSGGQLGAACLQQFLTDQPGCRFQCEHIGRAGRIRRQNDVAQRLAPDLQPHQAAKVVLVGGQHSTGLCTALQLHTADGVFRVAVLRFQAEDPAFRLRPAAVKAEAFFQPGAAQSGAGKLLLAVAQETGIPGNAAGLGRAGKVLDMPHEKALFIGAGRDKAPDCMNDRINRTRHCSPARPAGHP